jgi:hypothetical protein
MKGLIEYSDVGCPPVNAVRLVAENGRCTKACPKVLLVALALLVARRAMI